MGWKTWFYAGVFFFPRLALGQTGHLDVRVEGLDGGGAVNLLLFHSPQGFPDAPGAAIKSIRIPAPATGQPMRLRLGSLPYGHYAVSVFHDRNANGKLDRYPFGAPREPYGFSNGARGRFSAPPFQKAAFSLHTPHHEVAVRVR